jgi:hypothetical protein
VFLSILEFPRCFKRAFFKQNKRFKSDDVFLMWARICIVLHNLIIHIEGDNFDERWRESLVRMGLDYEHGASGDADEEDEPEDMLEHARRRLQMPGQHFRLKLMDDLFNSPSCMIHRCP